MESGLVFGNEFIEIRIKEIGVRFPCPKRARRRKYDSKRLQLAAVVDFFFLGHLTLDQVGELIQGVAQIASSISSQKST